MTPRIAFAALTLLATACTDEPLAGRTLRQAGFKPVYFTGYNAFACGESDYYATGFVAENARGDIVSGTVCCGLIFKGCTIRW